MTLPVISHTTDPFPGGAADAAVLVIPDPESAHGSLDSFDGLPAALAGIGYKGTASSYTRVHLPSMTELPLAVVSAGATPSAHSVRDAAAAAARSLTGFTTVSLALAPGLEQFADSAAEGALLGGYRFDDYRTEKKPGRAETFVLHVAEIDEKALERVRVVAESVALVKDLVSVPAEWQSPAQLAQSAADAVVGLPVEVETLDENQLEEQGFGGIIGVGRGSDRAPRLVRLSYSPAGSVRHIALVGKGITFDTGGLSLKSSSGMLGMKFDMAGSATVLATLRAIAGLSLPVRVTAWMCIADNMPSGRATRPGDVLRMLDGQTVEVLNTDAEGRLVLADGLVAASREQPDVIFDVATLTGAIITALGMRHTGVMGEDGAVAEYLAASERMGEPAWQLPLPEYMEDLLDSPIADMINANMSDRSGGSLFAGLFLQRFVGRVSGAEDAPRIPWVHLDIAGSAEHKGSAYGVTEKGPTGATVRSLVEFARASVKEV